MVFLLVSQEPPREVVPVTNPLSTTPSSPSTVDEELDLLLAEITRELANDNNGENETNVTTQPPSREHYRHVDHHHHFLDDENQLSDEDDAATVDLSTLPRFLYENDSKNSNDEEFGTGSLMDLDNDEEELLPSPMLPQNIVFEDVPYYREFSGFTQVQRVLLSVALIALLHQEALLSTALHFIRTTLHGESAANAFFISFTVKAINGNISTAESAVNTDIRLIYSDLESNSLILIAGSSEVPILNGPVIAIILRSDGKVGFTKAFTLQGVQTRVNDDISSSIDPSQVFNDLIW